VLFSYAGKLCWGFTAEWDLLPDLHDFVGDVDASFRELCGLPERIEIRPAARTKAPGRRRGRAAGSHLQNV